MQALLSELSQLGETTDNLALMAEAQAGLTALIPLVEAQTVAADALILDAEQQIAVAEAQLIAMTGTADATEAVRVIQEQALGQLQQLNANLQALFLSQKAVEESLHLPVPVFIQGSVPNTGFQTGGLVQTKLEPGERVYTNPSSSQTSALMAMNQAFPRFAYGGTVPGSGDGDSVPMALPAGSFVLNRNASRAVTGGRQTLQMGGTVTGGGITFNQTFNFPNLQVRNDQDIKKLAYEIERTMSKVIRSEFPK
jgi:hypothetical protein